MGVATEFVIPHQRRSFQVTRNSPINPMGTTNTGVVNFAAAPVAKWGTVYLPVVASTPSAPNRGGWCNVVNDIVFGTTIKFTRKGLYQFNVSMTVPGIEEAPFPQIGTALILDSSAASMLVATALLPTTLNRFGAAGVIDWKADQNKTTVTSISLNGQVAITKAMSAYATADLPQPVAGETGIGVVRLHANNNAGGEFAAAGLILSLWCNQTNDMAG